MHDSTVFTSATTERGAGSDGSDRWLVLTHHLPPSPPYLRVKVRRRLRRIGAVPLKNSVYVLPETADTLEDFQWVFQEIEREGGEATLSEASFVDGVTAGRLIERFREAREADYTEVTDSARALLEDVRRDDADASAPPGVVARLGRLTKRLGEVIEVDFFAAPGRAAAEHAVRRAKEACVGETEAVPAAGEESARVSPGTTWVTRAGVKIDRIASAWLIRRFIDPDATFRFTPDRAYRPAEGEIRFDMFDGEYTHEGDACTFETLRTRFGLADLALEALAELVHDIDCKDDKFGRPEAAGLASMIDGLVRRHPDDLDRLARGAEIFEGLYEHFSRPAT